MLTERLGRMRSRLRLVFGDPELSGDNAVGVALIGADRLREKTDLPFVCVIAGDGDEFDRIGREIVRLGLEDVVIQAGYRTDTRELLCSADAYVSTALYNEAMSFAILEAMSCSLPLAVTDVGAGRDLAEGCGQVVPPGDPEAMAEALCTLLADRVLCASLGRVARERVGSDFDFRKSAEELRTIYEGG